MFNKRNFAASFHIRRIEPFGILRFFLTESALLSNLLHRVRKLTVNPPSLAMII
ncbi:hypothetical protein [Candidatus Electronema sp. JM]|uniref:hypothetical protein n=1 Tax=Candidatus Electronema sp. JM TaxID=3401571 RepID=UPI003AA8A4D5